MAFSTLKRFLKTWVIPPGWIRPRKPSGEVVHKPSVPFHLTNERRDDSLFVLASGPSIAKCDLSLLEGRDNMAVSFFHLHERIEKLRPKYHVLAPQHAPFTFDDSSKYFEGFADRYASFRPDIFLGVTNYAFDYRALLQQKPELDLFPFHFIDYSGAPQLDETNYSNPSHWDPTDRPFACRTVIYSAIQIAFHLGYKEICLLGVDHDYLADINRTQGHHFYDEKLGISDVAHLSQFTRERWFLEYYLRWKQYRLMKTFLESQGVRIVNLSPGSYLDVFETDTIENYLASKRR